MTRLNEVFENLKKQNKKANSVFLMSGYPDFETSLDLMNITSENGVDFIELGMPFSDPSADGPSVRYSGTCALQNGVTVKSTIELVKKFRQNNKKTPLVWMGYFNSIFNYGVEKFLDEIELAGIDGVLIVDLPVFEYERIKYIEQKNLDLIRLVTPTTTKERLDEILKTSKGFIYFVSINGITGTKEAQEDFIRQNVEYIKTKTNLPVVVGFGIKNAQKAREINKFADGTIVGSALIDIITKNPDKSTMFNEVKNFIKDFT